MNARSLVDILINLESVSLFLFGPSWNKELLNYGYSQSVTAKKPVYQFTMQLSLFSLLLPFCLSAGAPLVCGFATAKSCLTHLALH